MRVIDVIRRHKLLISFAALICIVAQGVRGASVLRAVSNDPMKVPDSSTSSRPLPGSSPGPATNPTPEKSLVLVQCKLHAEL